MPQRVRVLSTFGAIVQRLCDDRETVEWRDRS
jgi:hypothetical protein